MGANRSGPSTGLTATGVFLMSTNAAGFLDDSGNANPDLNFRYSNGAYVFNLKSTGMGAGTYGLDFVASGDPTVHTVQFRVR